MEKNDKLLRKPVLLATLLLTAVSLSACVIPSDRGGDRGNGWGRHHHWKNDRDWKDGNNGPGWQNNDDYWKKRRHWND